MKVKLPPREIMPKPDDEGPWIFYYIPGTSYVYKKRLINTLKLLGQGHERLIDIGFGNGIFFPALSQCAKNIYGIEIHDVIKDVFKMLEKMELKAELKRASLFEIPYTDGFFDSAVSVSVFEHIKPEDLDRAFQEARRILEKGGVLVVSFPVRNIITDSFFRAVGHDPRRIHPSSHRDIIESAKKYFTVEQILLFPKFLPIDLSLYCSIKCVKE